MSFLLRGQAGPDYQPCRYGTSKIQFRGPQKPPDGRYAVFFGGTETYGKFQEKPFPHLVEQATGMPVINLGCVNAGLDVFMQDRSLVEIAAGAEMTVLQVLGTQNVSNRFYAVHPRRNDRFLRASRILKAIYGEIDFTEFHFTGHLLKTLRDASDIKFSLVIQELQEAWVARMRSCLSQIEGDTVVLWLSQRSPDDPPDDISAATEPLFVTREMLDALRNHATHIIEIVARPEEISAGRLALRYDPSDEAAAQEMLGPLVHERVCDAIAPLIPTGKS